MESNDALAIVAHGPVSSGQWNLEPVNHRGINDGEVLVRVVATGICLADVHIGDVPPADAANNPAIWYPRVLGHEGAGYVEQVGRSVRSVQVGDPVILSYRSCGECYNCEDGHPAYCTKVFACNFEGEKGCYAKRGSREFSIGGCFFGQSSFASKAIVREGCIVSLRGLDVSEEELKVLAPLGCGVQTGSGAFLNIANVQPHEEVAVLGVGGVGQSAIMAAAMRKCKTIIAIDRDESRLRKAASFGATHTVNTSNTNIDLVAEVLKITGGRGVHVSLDTTGVQPLARQSWFFVRNFGKVLQVGLAQPGDSWDIPMADHMNSGKQIIGCVQGDAIPQKYIPEMIRWWREGKLPVDRLATTYPVAQYSEALNSMRSGQAIKPVLIWPALERGRM